MKTVWVVLASLGSILVPAVLINYSADMLNSAAIKVLLLPAMMVMAGYAVNKMLLVGRRRGYNTMLDAFGYASLGNGIMVAVYAITILLIARMRSDAVGIENGQSFMMLTISYLSFIGFVAGVCCAFRAVGIWYKMMAISLSLVAICVVAICLNGVLGLFSQDIVLRVTLGSIVLMAICGYKVLIYDVQHV